MLLFSKLNNMFFGYFNPENMCRDNENGYFPGWPTRCFGYKRSTVLHRYELGKGLPGQRPMSTMTPGAGAYETRSAMGTQVLSNNNSEPRGKIGTENRDKFAKQYISPGHEKPLYGRNSPGPCLYDVVKGNGTFSRESSASFFKIK